MRQLRVPPGAGRAGLWRLARLGPFGRNVWEELLPLTAFLPLTEPEAPCEDPTLGEGPAHQALASDR
jgi:hypothetical protein